MLTFRQFLEDTKVASLTAEDMRLIASEIRRLTAHNVQFRFGQQSRSTDEGVVYTTWLDFPRSFDDVSDKVLQRIVPKALDAVRRLHFKLLDESFSFLGADHRRLAQEFLISHAEPAK